MARRFTPRHQPMTLMVYGETDFAAHTGKSDYNLARSRLR
jgi:hypothetical protein